MQPTNIRVAVRVRPPNRKELEQNQRTIIKVEDSTTLTFDPDEDEDEFFFHGTKQSHRDITRKVNKKLAMHFDDIFDNDAMNHHIFETCMKPLVKSVMEGYNCSVFVYGATGAGKTYTMLGSEEQPGITYLTMGYLFDQITGLSNERKFDIGISYLEVYNEQVMNLLTKSGPLKLREDSNGVVVGGLALKPIYNAEELLNLLALGNKNRTQHPTDANAESSRSHAIFQVHIRMINKGTGTKNTVKLSMIDLAGSERAASTKCMGMRFKEGASINKSLLALGNCINKLADGCKHIPYRDSNLTRIIKDSLGGNCQTVMIANVSPSSLTYEDTYNTLKYASRAKKIRTNVKLNLCKINTPKDVLVRQLTDHQTENLRLKNLVQELEMKLKEANNNEENRIVTQTEGEARPDFETEMTEITSWYSKIDAIYEVIKHAAENYYMMASKEKVLQFRIQIKEYTEDAMKILTLDGSDLNMDIGKLGASIDRFSKQIGRHQQEGIRWKKCLTEKQIELKKLQRSANEQGVGKWLEPYFRGKEFELDALRKHYKYTHVSNINSIYFHEQQHLIKTLQLSARTLQHSYLLFKSNDLIDITMRDNFDKLKRLNRSRDVKFAEEKQIAQVHKEEREPVNNELLNLTIDEYATSIVMTKPLCVPVKRNRVDDDNSVKIDVKRPNKRLNFEKSSTVPCKSINSVEKSPPQASSFSNLNETHVLATHIADDFESMPPPTINITAVKPKAAHLNGKNSKITSTSRTNLLRNILHERNGSDTSASSTVTTNALSNKVMKIGAKSSGSGSKVTLKINKENNKYSPNRVGKSPKSRTPNKMLLKSRPRLLSADHVTVSKPKFKITK